MANWLLLLLITLPSLVIKVSGENDNQTLQEIKELVKRQVKCCECQCLPPFQKANGLCLYLRYPMFFQYWDRAKDFCKSVGGYLAEYYNEDDFNAMRDFVISKLKPGGTKIYGWYHGAWIGGTDLDIAGAFKWDRTGANVSMTYGWAVNQPDYFAYERYMHFIGRDDFYINNVYNPFPRNKEAVSALCQIECNELPRGSIIKP